MAKDQFKAKTKEVALTTRFTVLPLIDKGDQYLCVDANFQFLMVTKARLEEYENLALPEVVNDALHEQAVQAARVFLPSDSKQVDRLRQLLKTKGPEGFEAELQKILG
ncbi:hypothetical protein JXA80_00600 [bacterium]|nr:hypothetical protein [candidate division CSSED10-310 bacterium]